MLTTDSTLWCTLCQQKSFDQFVEICIHWLFSVLDCMHTGVSIFSLLFIINQRDFEVKFMVNIFPLLVMLSFYRIYSISQNILSKQFQSLHIWKDIWKDSCTNIRLVHLWLKWQNSHNRTHSIAPDPFISLQILSIQRKWEFYLKESFIAQWKLNSGNYNTKYSDPLSAHNSSWTDKKMELCSMLFGSSFPSIEASNNCVRAYPQFPRVALPLVYNKFPAQQKAKNVHWVRRFLFYPIPQWCPVNVTFFP